MPDSKRAQTGAVLRHRNFALLWSGQTISIAGNGIFTVALPLEVLHLTGSSLDLAIVICARTIPSLILLLIGGTLVDRLSRRAVMLASDATCGVALALLTILIVTGRAHVEGIVVLAIILGAASAFFRPASTAIVRDILPSELFVSANSLSSLSSSLAQSLLGPLAGGVIVAAAGYSWAFGIDAMSFAVSAACLAAMRNITEVRAAKERITSGMAEGIRYCRSQPWLWWSMIALGVANLACFAPGSSLLPPLIIKDAFHGGPTAVGVMFAAIGSGGTIASIITTRLKTPRRRVRATWVAWILAGLSSMSVGLAPWLWLAVACSAVSWGLVAYGNIIWLSMVQEETPPTLLGRVSSIDWLFSLSLTPLGTLAGGAAVLAIGVRLTVIAGGAIAAASGAVLLIPGVTDLDRPKEQQRLTVPAATTAD
jgi:predicted MFS family arabinose efflux permease